MHFAELTPVEQRVLGCLIEKRWTTPDQYPLSLNALRLACNQSTNRDPVTDYDESAVRDAAQRLSRYGLARLASGAGSRATKYRHLAEEGLGLDREQLAVLCVLLLRGPQTPGELKARSERMARLPDLADVERVLGELIDRGYAARIERRPGQKEDRFEQLLGGGEGSVAAAPGAAAPGAVPPVLGAPMSGAGALASEAPVSGAGALASGAPVSAVGMPTAGSPVSGAPVSDPIVAAGFDEPVASSPVDNGELEARVAALEADLAALRAELADLLN